MTPVYLCQTGNISGEFIVVCVSQALKRDVIRSIIARCELLCEDLLQTEEEQGLHHF